MTPIAPIASIGMEAVSATLSLPPVANPTSAQASGFSEQLNKGLDHVQHKLNEADSMVRAFALDDSVPIHQVTIALEEARIAVELAMQVRSHLIEAYRQVMNTQL